MTTFDPREVGALRALWSFVWDELGITDSGACDGYMHISCLDAERLDDLAEAVDEIRKTGGYPGYERVSDVDAD